MQHSIPDNAGWKGDYKSQRRLSALTWPPAYVGISTFNLYGLRGVYSIWN